MQKYQRIFIIGNLYGHYEKLINLLYLEDFSVNDLLVSTGDLIHFDSTYSLDVLEFFMNNNNCVLIPDSIEKKLIALYEAGNIDVLPLWVKDYPDAGIYDYIKNCPNNVILDNKYVILNNKLEKPATNLKEKIFITNIENHSLQNYEVYSVRSEESVDAPLNYIIIDYTGASPVVIKTQTVKTANEQIDPINPISEEDYINNIQQTKGFIPEWLKNLYHKLFKRNQQPSQPPIDNTIELNQQENVEIPVSEDVNVEIPVAPDEAEINDAITIEKPENIEVEPIQFEDWDKQEPVETTVQQEIPEQVKQEQPHLEFYQSTVSNEYSFSPTHSVGVDQSLVSLLYLQAFGYSTVQWILNERHPEYDVCDRLNGNYFSINDLIQNAEEVKSDSGHMHPPATMWSASHPGCICYLNVIKPESFHDIPDNAPGLPMNADYEVLSTYKQKLYALLPTHFKIDAVMMPPTLKTVEAFVRYELFQTKTASQPNFKELIKPCVINKDTTVNMPFGFTHPLSKGDKGFIISVNQEKSEVEFYSSEYNSIYIIPSSSITIVKLTESQKTKPENGDFVFIDGSEAIIHRILNDNIQAFLPEAVSIVTTNIFDILEAS